MPDFGPGARFFFGTGSHAMRGPLLRPAPAGPGSNKGASLRGGTRARSTKVRHPNNRAACSAVVWSPRRGGAPSGALSDAVTPSGAAARGPFGGQEVGHEQRRSPTAPSYQGGRALLRGRWRGGASGLLVRLGSNGQPVGASAPTDGPPGRFGATLGCIAGPWGVRSPREHRATVRRQRPARATDSLVEQSPEVERPSSKVQPWQHGRAARGSSNGVRAQTAATRAGCQGGKSFEG